MTNLKELFGDESDSEDQCDTDFECLPLSSQIISFEKIPGLVLAKMALSKPILQDISQQILEEGWFDASQGCNQRMNFGKLPDVVEPISSLWKFVLPRSFASRSPRFDQMIANYYTPGEGLTPHVDLLDKFDDGILVASIIGTCTMTFTHVDDLACHNPIHVFLEAGDVVGLSGDARWKWKHGIPDRTQDTDENGHLVSRTARISITLRKLTVTTI